MLSSQCTQPGTECSLFWCVGMCGEKEETEGGGARKRGIEKLSPLGHGRQDYFSD